MGVAPLTITPSNPLAKFLLPVPTTLCSAGLEALVPKGGICPSEDTSLISLNWKLRMPPGHFGPLMPLDQQAKKRVIVLVGVIDPDYQGEIGLILCNGGKEKYVWNAGDLLGHVLVLPCPLIKVNGTLQQPFSDMTSNSPDPSGTKVWITPPGKDP
ncbi:deoxyuridine 5'-triphosphate nucleotidohydrolase-like [Loxodonta africana]|uniref:deoxyuridine 5'-triphosphate nucleotidohydrolase-like n=1 Tax=Loxodonta africana TaxID=9785 RepID=UPI0030D5C011